MMHIKNLLDKLAAVSSKNTIHTPADNLLELKEDLGLNDRIPELFSQNPPDIPTNPDSKDLTKNASDSENEGEQVRSGLAHNRFLYRGQTSSYYCSKSHAFTPCRATIFRIVRKEECFLELQRTILFEKLLGDIPEIRGTGAQDAGSGSSVSRTGIAQHYGMATNLLDLTSSFEIASFFATCDDVGHGEYVACRSGSVGIIYVVLAPMFHGMLDARLLGRQPVPRPAQQQACALKMRHGDDLNKYPLVFKFFFCQDEGVSRKILEDFDYGRTLFPEQDICNKVKNVRAYAKKQNRFSKHIFDEACQRFYDYFNLPS